MNALDETALSIRTALTTMASTARQVCVGLIEGMSALALRLGGVSRSDRVASHGVLSWRHRFEMIWSHAHSVPAKMVDLHSFRNWANHLFVSESVRVDGDNFGGSRTSPELPVPTGLFLARELPASFSDFYMPKEARKRFLWLLPSNQLGLQYSNSVGNWIMPSFTTSVKGV